MKSLAILVALLPLCNPANVLYAAEISIAATSATVVTTSEGKSQIVVLMTRPEGLDHISLGEARLRLSHELVADESLRRMQVHALRSSYVSGEPQLHDGLVGRILIEGGSSARVVDLSNLIRGVLHEEEFYGLLVTAGEGVEGGFESADAQELLSSFQGATLDIEYRRVPPRRMTQGS